MLKILAIEDDAAVQQVIEMLLVRQLPYDKEIAFATTWARAWEMLGSTHYNVVLLDLILPDSTPEETVKKIPEILRYADAVCVVTGTGERFREASIALGAFGHFEKHAAFGEKRRGFIQSIVHHIQKRNPTVAQRNLEQLKATLARQETNGA